MFNMSAAMAGEFVAAATHMAEVIATLGPNPLRDAAPATHQADRGD